MIDIAKHNPFPPMYGPQSEEAEQAYLRAHDHETPSSIHRWYDSTIPLWTSWDVVQARGALDAHTSGNFYMSSLLWDEMRSYEALDSAIKTRILGVNSRPVVVRPNPRASSRRLAAMARDMFAERVDEIVSHEFIAQTMTWSEGSGFSAAQMVWSVDERRWWPTLQHWQNALVYFMTTARKYMANTMEGPAAIECGDGQWVLHTPFGYYRGWLGGAVRSLAMPWLATMYAMRDWMRFCEVHGLPIKLLKIPASASSAQKQQFESLMTQLSNESVVALPQNVSRDGASWDVTLLEAQSRSWTTFSDAIDKYEKRFAIRLLGQNLTTDVDAGSLAAANVHDRVRLDFTKNDVRALSETICQQIVRPWAKFNFGDELLAPIVTWDVVPVEDVQARNQAESSVATAVAALVQAGVPVDVEAYLSKRGIPTIKQTTDQKSPRGQFFQYHLDYGLITTNEMRASLGLPPVDGGDVPPKRIESATPSGSDQMTLAEPAGPPPTAERSPDRRTARTLSGASDGHQYVDQLIDSGKTRLAVALKPTVAAVTDAIRDAKSFDEVESALKKLAGNLDSSEAEDTMTQAITLAHLAGRLAAHEDHPTNVHDHTDHEDSK